MAKRIALEPLFANQNKWFEPLLRDSGYATSVTNTDRPGHKYPFSSSDDAHVFRLYFFNFNYNTSRHVCALSGDVVLPIDDAEAALLARKLFSSVGLDGLRRKLHQALAATPTLKFLKTLLVSPKSSGLRSFDGSETDALEYLFSDDRCCRCLDLTPGATTNGILVREWNDDIRIAHELRVFVIDNRIVGISQQSSQYSAFMCSVVEHIKDNVVAQIRDRIVCKLQHIGRYCADIAIGPDCVVVPIEINPFYDWCNTGLCLFDSNPALFDPDNPPFLTAD